MQLGELPPKPRHPSDRGFDALLVAAQLEAEQEHVVQRRQHREVGALVGEQDLGLELAPVVAELQVGGGDDGALGRVAAAPDHHRSAGQLRAPQHLDGGDELGANRIHVGPVHRPRDLIVRAPGDVGGGHDGRVRAR